MTYQFKPWEKPTHAKPTPGSVTVDIPANDLLEAKLVGITKYQSPFDGHPDDADRIWYLHRRYLGDGSTLYLEPMLPGHLSLCLAPDKWNLERWCYHDHDAAWRAVLGWNGVGDPEGWYRHPLSGRRRPDGLIENEYINASER